MKGCEEGGMMMMFVKMRGGVLGHHERLKEVGKEGGQSIMKKQTYQKAV